MKELNNRPKWIALGIAGVVAAVILTTLLRRDPSEGTRWGLLFKNDKSAQQEKPTSTPPIDHSNPILSATPGIGNLDIGDSTVTGGVGRCLMQKSTKLIVKIARNEDDVYQLEVIDPGETPEGDYREGQIFNVDVQAFEADEEMTDITCPTE